MWTYQPVETEEEAQVEDILDMGWNEEGEGKGSRGRVIVRVCGSIDLINAMAVLLTTTSYYDW